MANCHEMRVGEIYECKDCGLELQVVSECRSKDIPVEDCGCHLETSEYSDCIFCCNQPLVKKA